MSFDITVVITSDTATPAVRELVSSFTPAEMAGRIGPAVQDLVRKHLGRLPPNKMGWPTTGFYEKFARGVGWTPVADGVVIGILPIKTAHGEVGLRQRVFGGEIRPVVAKALAIPMCAEAYGKAPGDFDNLVMIKTPKGAYLVQKGKGKNAPVIFMFKLSFGVSQEGDRNVLPSDQEITETALIALKKN